MLRLAVALAAVAGSVLLSGCDYFTLCGTPKQPPTPFTLLLRAFYCPRGGVAINPIVPQFQILQSSPGSSVPQQVTAVPSGSVVIFDPGASYIAVPDNRDDQVESFFWDFHGDGEPASPPSTPMGRGVTALRFVASSTKRVTITLTVLDSLGLTEMVTRTLTVFPVSPQAPGPDVPPVAKLTVTPNPATPGQAVSFDGSGTSDSSGKVTDYKWDFGDGKPGVDSGATPTTAHTYGCSGRLTATLTATNGGGQTGQDHKVLFVTPMSGWPPCPGSGPAATFTATPNPAMPESLVTFDASASNDSQGPITDYFWEFGDGTHGDSASPTITHSYFCAGTVTVTLTIADGSSMSDHTTRTETVSPSPGFPACSPGPAADGARAPSQGGPRSFFRARFGRARVLARGAVTRHGSTATLRGLVIAGGLRGSLVRSPVLARFDRARFVAALTLAMDGVRHAITVQGLALATFPGARNSRLCLRLDATRQGAHLPIGTFRVLGGTGAAAGLSGGGTFVFALDRKGGRLAGRLRVDNPTRSGRRGRSLPLACRSLLR